MPRITPMLVTGGAGFIGANFIHHTLRHHPEYEICVLDALTYASVARSPMSVANRITWISATPCCWTG